MGQLSLAFLGAPEVRHAGQVLTFSTRKTLALLIYLATQGGQHSRDKITALFWPESDPRRGRAAMRRTLTRLREVLPGPYAFPAPSLAGNEGSRHLIIEGDTLGFDFASDFDLDLHALEAAWALARTAASSGEAQSDARLGLLESLQAAVLRYRGDFLEGFSLPDAPDFDEWASIQREAWHRRMDLVLGRLSQLQSEYGETVDAIDTTRRWVAHDPYNEAAHRRLIQLYFMAGDRAKALQAYQACRAVLAADLNAEPDPETEALAERLRAEGPRRVEPPARSRPDQAPMKLPLVGRAAEHGHLVAAYQAVRRGQAQAVAIVGEAGIGKTRLAAEFLAWSEAQGAVVLRGRAFETGGRLPYQPLVDALREWLERERSHLVGQAQSPGQAQDLPLLGEVWWAELSRLLPELRDRYPGLPQPTQDEGTARARLFEAVVRLEQSLAERLPLVLFVDDLQWADAASLDLLHYSARRWTESKTPALLVFSLRSEALVTTLAVADWLAGLERDVSVTRLKLGPLTAEDTLRLVRSLAAAEPSSDSRRFSDWLYAETGGQPFYIVESLKAMLERGVLAWRVDQNDRWVLDFEATMRSEAAGEGGHSHLQAFVPPGVREVIRARLARLSPSAVALLAAAAVLGQRFSFERLCQVADVRETAGLPALDELLSRRLLLEVEGGPNFPSGGPYVFAHDKIRDVVYTEAGDARRRIFHRRAFEMLHGAGAPPAELAHQALMAGLSEPAFHYSLAAGDEAMGLFAVRDAIVYYQQAQQVGEQHELTVENWPHLYTQLGRAYELTDQWEEAQAVYQAMLTLAREAGQPGVECAALNRLATLAAWVPADSQEAMALLEQARQVAEGSHDRAGLAETECNLGLVNLYAFELGTSHAHGQRALTLARALGQGELVARSLNVLAFAATGLGRWAEAAAVAQEGRALAASLGNRALEADCLNVIAEALINTGSPRTALSVGREAYAISLAIENRWGQASGASHIAFALLECGEYGEALQLAQTGLAAVRAMKTFLALPLLSLTILGDVYRAMRALERARAAHREALAVSETLAIRPFARLVASELCADCVLAGAWPEAYSYARQTLAAKEHTLFHGGLAHWHLIEALLWGGDVELAQEEVRRFGERAGDNPRYRIPHLRCLAVLAEWDGDLERATAHLEEADILTRDLGLLGEQWQVLAALGEVYRQRGDQDQARHFFTRSADIVQTLAGKIEDEELRACFLAAQPFRRP